MCITESFCCTPEINPTFSINYTSKKKKKNWVAVKIRG